MATIVLQAAGAFVGGAFGSVGSAIGSAAGAIAGYAIDRALIQGTKRYEGPRLTSMQPFTAEEGASLPRIYGTIRAGGTVIWATRYEEDSTTTRQGGKGAGAKTTSYSYFANAAFAICEGEIAGVRRIWADGREVDRERVDIRIYRGDDEQLPDPLIEAKQGEGNAPAYRGTAYAVVERFPIDDYGRRLPQFQFEVIRPVGELHKRVRSIALIPGSTEYGLATDLVTRTVEEGETEGVNRHVTTAATDFEAALDELQMLCPNLENIALVVSWFGDDLRAGACRLRPMVTQPDPEGFSMDWKVSGIERASAGVVSRIDGGAAYGGTPCDKSVMQAIAAIKARGLKVTFYPFIMMDVAVGNGLPDPYGGAAQPPYPWRGRITCDPAPGRDGSADKNAAAAAQVASFLGSAVAGDFSLNGDTVAFTGDAEDWGFRRFILHHAHLAKAAGGVDGFVVGSELRGLTTLRSDGGAFPFVDALRQLAGEARTILGGDVSMTYGADWSEYFGHQPADGSGDVLFHLDPLWADPAIDTVGIDNYMPLSDWRDADYAGGNPDGFRGPYDRNGLRGSVAAGEGFDWYYGDGEDRAGRVRTPISDGAYGKPWVFRYKDLVNWWSKPHYNRHGGVEDDEATPWVPCSKPMSFTELGCPAVDKGPNQPNVFPDPKSSENATPYFSDGGRCDLAQARFLEAQLGYWAEADEAANPISNTYGGRMLDADGICLWAWDARPFPAFPLRDDTWRDGGNWALGHWLNGRLNGATVADLINAILADQSLPPADVEHVDGSVSGYIVEDPTSARAAIDPITAIFGINGYETADGLTFRSVGQGAGASIDPGMIVLPDHAPSVARTRQAVTQLPDGGELAFRNEMNEHQSASSRMRRPEARSSAESMVGFPGVLATGQAQALITDWLRMQWAGRERIAFSLPAGTEGAEPGRILSLAGFADNAEYVVSEVETGITSSVKARRVVCAAPTPWIPEEIAGKQPVSLVTGKPLAYLLDLPLTGASQQPEEQLRVAARARPWRAQAVLASPEATGFEPRASLGRRATIGLLAEALDAGSFEGRMDEGGEIRVRLLDGELASTTIPQLLNGSNAVAVLTRGGAWEVLQFRDAEEIEPSLWRLSGLLRGQLGTCDAMRCGADAGGPLVVLDDALAPAGLRHAEIGLSLNWKIGPQGFDLSSDHFASLSAIGGIRSQLPLSPVHLHASRLENGDLDISWIRRGRISADDWQAVDIPLGETSEAYRVDVSAPDESTVRSVTVVAPQWTYAADMIAGDFPQMPVSIGVSVSQISTTVGRGVAAHATFAIA